MRLPKRIDEIVKEKELLLDKLRTKFEKTTIGLQMRLFESAVADIITRLDIKNGEILETSNNYRLITELDKLYNSFNILTAATVLPQIIKGTEAISALNNGLFKVTIEVPDRFEKIIESTKKITDLRLGLRGGKMVRGGFLMSMLKSDPTEFKQFMSKAITSQMPVKEFIGAIKTMIVGSEEKIGSLQKQFQRFAYDVYSQYDAAYNRSMAEDLGLKYFAYQNNIIEDSRDFCVAHYNKVWTVEEAQDWSNWTPAKGIAEGQFPSGYVIKAKRLNEVPSYMSFVGYDPLIDIGGYNCRHILAYISEGLARKWRPDIK
jgi:hypothetical protein